MEAASRNEFRNHTPHPPPPAPPRLDTPVRDEALARLEYLVTHGKRLGLLIGPSGSGKTLVARQFVRDVRRQLCDVVVANVLGMDATELLWTINAQLGLRRTGPDTRLGLWRMLADRLAGNRFERRSTVIVLDEAEHASREAVEITLRLLHLATDERMPLTLVLVARGEHFEWLDQRLRELVELRIELEPWAVEETAAFVRDRFATAGLAESGLAQRAVEQLQELTGGSPRGVAQLTELALVAQQDREGRPLDPPTVLAIFDELSGLAGGISTPAN